MAVTPELALVAKLTPVGRTPFSPFSSMKLKAVTCHIRCSSISTSCQLSAYISITRAGYLKDKKACLSQSTAFFCSPLRAYQLQMQTVQYGSADTAKSKKL